MSQQQQQQQQQQQEMSGERGDFKNYYQILELNSNATTPEIEKAYQKLSLRWHPDKHRTDRKLAERKFH
jgi:curved DNA-binding protein CbpA